MVVGIHDTLGDGRNQYLLNGNKSSYAVTNSFIPKISFTIECYLKRFVKYEHILNDKALDYTAIISSFVGGNSIFKI